MNAELKFVQVGGGTAVHILLSGQFTLCGAGAASHITWRGMSDVREVAGPATCKRCIKQEQIRRPKLNALDGIQ